MNQQQCPSCQGKDSYCYKDIWSCPYCGHEWSLEQVAPSTAPLPHEIKDAHGNVLKDGDSVSVIKDLKVKGSSSVVKVGTKVKNIRLITDAIDGHNIACRIDGIGQMNLKSDFVKKT